MSPLSFSLGSEPGQRIDVSPLTADGLAGKDRAEIGAILLQTGNRQVRADALFDIQGDDPGHIQFKRTGGRLDFVGHGMSRGVIEVHGDAGSYLGMRMTGGRIEVRGTIDAYGACELRNGTVVIQGDAGDFLGACLPGNKKGMAGGLVIVKGRVGARAGDRMRRGALLIEGDAGDYLGSRMTAGTIAVLGQVGAHPGYGMGRGTLLLARVPVEIPPTFNDCGTHTLGFIPLLLRSFPAHDTVFADMADRLKRVRRYAGDFCALGKGEILVAAAG